MDEFESQRTHPLDYVSVIRRRRLWFVVPIVAALLTGAALALFLPAWYESRATLAVSAPNVSQQLAGPATPLDHAERTRAFEQQLLSAGTIGRVAREVGHAGADDDLIIEWRRRIKVEPASPITDREGDESTTFVLSFYDRSPSAAQVVTRRLSEAFVEENNRAREAQAQGTSSFLEAQLRASEERLAKLDEQMREQKQANMGRLPEQTEANLELVSGLRQQLEATSIALRGEQDRLSMVERQLETLEQDAGRQAEMLSETSPLLAARSRVDKLSEDLAAARARYTDQHPEIGRLTGELDSARAQLERERSRPGADRKAAFRSSPSYRQLETDRETARLRIRDLQRTESQLAQQIAEYQARIEAAPLVEQRLSALQRQYELERKANEDLSARHKAAVLAENLQRRQGTERFTVLYPASLPTKPFAPNRSRILLGALLAGIVLGLALPFAREFLDRSVHDARALQQQFDVPVVGEIPTIRNAA